MPRVGPAFMVLRAGVYPRRSAGCCPRGGPQHDPWPRGHPVRAVTQPRASLEAADATVPARAATDETLALAPRERGGSRLTVAGSPAKSMSDPPPRPPRACASLALLLTVPSPAPAYLLGGPLDPSSLEQIVSLLFKTKFLGHTLHVLDIRGRVAFIAAEMGVAAGHLFGGDRFLTQLTREWAELLEDDDDVAFLTGRESERVRREAGLSLSTRERLVLFAPGVRKALAKSNARLAAELQRFLDEDVYPRVAAEKAIRDPDERGANGSSNGSPTTPPPRSVMSLEPAVESEAFVRRCTEYVAVRRFANLLLVHRQDLDAYLLLERYAVEALLGHPLWTDPPPGAPVAAADAPVAA